MFEGREEVFSFRKMRSRKDTKNPHILDQEAHCMCSGAVRNGSFRPKVHFFEPIKNS